MDVRMHTLLCSELWTPPSATSLLMYKINLEVGYVEFTESFVMYSIFNTPPY